MKKVMAFGTFDIFHPGHESYLRQAKKLGDYLIVVVARDKTVREVKKQETRLRQGFGGQARNKEQKRIQTLKNSNLADEVILGSLKDKYAVIKKHKPDIIALGYDQKVNLKELKSKLREFKLDKTAIIRLKSYYPAKYKTSILRKC
jgi:FAD synthetase